MSRSASTSPPGQPNPTVIDPAVLDQAAHWFVRLASGQASTQDHHALLQWRDADPEHERAWQRLQGVEQKLRGGALPAPVARAALGAVDLGRRRTLKTLAVAGAALGSAALWQREQGLWQRWTADYRSGVGERREVLLADGTRLLLNTDTAVDVRFDAALRRLVLRSGELRITTGHDAQNRGFVVATRDGTLRPLGTRFTVRRLDDEQQTRLAVSEGAVEVRPGNATAAPLVVQAGQRTVFSATGAAPPSALDEAAGSWTDGILTAERMRLQDFLAELERYRPGRLHCDPAVAELRLTGAYPLADTDRILAALQQTLPVRVRYYTRYWVSVAAR
jgi:transmembrane sensor